MQLHGPFSNQSTIDKHFTGEGRDVSPPVRWTDVPAGVMSFVLIADDPDAPSPRKPAPHPWVHWVIYNIPQNATGLPEGVERTPHPRQVRGAAQGINSWPRDNVGYLGPMPPEGSGPHRYFFKLYALDCVLDLEPARANKEAVNAAMSGHILAEAEMIGTYERK